MTTFFLNYTLLYLGITIINNIAGGEGPGGLTRRGVNNFLLCDLTS